MVLYYRTSKPTITPAAIKSSAIAIVAHVTPLTDGPDVGGGRGAGAGCCGGAIGGGPGRCFQGCG
jgi:hypothetical protein